VCQPSAAWFSEERFRNVISKSADGILIVDKTGTVCFTNPAAESLFGRKGEELLGAPFGFPLVAGETTEVDIIPKYAQTVVAEMRIVETEWEGETAYLASLRDITERKRAEAERAHRIREQSARAEAERAQKQIVNILESITDGFIALDKEWRFTYLNQEAEELFERLQRTREQVIGKNIWEEFPELVGSTFDKQYHRVVAEQVTVEFEEFYPPMDRWLEIRAYPSREGLSVYFRDITGRKQAEEELRRASQAKDEFLAMVSHELRTPLNAMLGWARLLRTGKLDEEDCDRALETIERNALSQAHLIEDLIDVSRIISGKLRLDVRPVEPVSVIDAAIDTVRPAADANKIRLQVVLDPKAGPVSGDPDRLQQVVWNLLSNAVKFTPKEGRVQVRLERVNSHVEITVSDTGKGIKGEFLPHVFERFRQADSTLTRSRGGLGLGLAIVRHLVELHGGTVHAYSPGEEQGATFTVKLPLMIVHDEERFPTRTQERMHPTARYDAPFECPPSLDGLRVLVVDDEADARQLLVAVLAQCKAEVTTVASVAEALEALEQLRPDVLVSDIEMPGEDGYSLIRKLRAMEAERGGHIPAAALTAHARVEDRMRALSAGYEMHVAKPVEPAELVMVIASLAGRRGRE
jgi:PAS domain S-box-containing protein